MEQLDTEQGNAVGLVLCPVCRRIIQVPPEYGDKYIKITCGKCKTQWQEVVLMPNLILVVRKDIFEVLGEVSSELLDYLKKQRQEAKSKKS